MHDTRLEDGFGEGTFQRHVQAGEPVSAHKQDVLEATALELGEDLQPELGPFRLRSPDAEQLATAVEPNGKRQIEGALLHL